MPWAALSRRSRRSTSYGGLRELQQMAHDVLKHRRIELVEDFLPLPLGRDEPGVAKNRKVPRNGRPARMEVVGNLARRAGTAAEKRQDIAARLVRQRAEHGVGRRHQF